MADDDPKRMAKATLDTSGPAFPRAPGQFAPGQFRDATAGLTLRDYFAAAALPYFTPIDDELADDDLARRCYEVADALLAARARASEREP